MNIDEYIAWKMGVAKKVIADGGYEPLSHAEEKEWRTIIQNAILSQKKKKEKEKTEEVLV